MDSHLNSIPESLYCLENEVRATKLWDLDKLIDNLSSIVVVNKNNVALCRMWWLCKFIQEIKKWKCFCVSGWNFSTLTHYWPALRQDWWWVLYCMDFSGLWTTTCVSNNSECTHLTQFDTLHIKSRALDIKSRALDPKSVACHLLPNQERSPLELVGDLSRPMVRMQVVIELEIKTIQSEYKSC